MDASSFFAQRAIRLGAVALASLSLLACASSSPGGSAAAAVPAVAAAVTTPAVLAQDVAPGIYELVYSPANHAVYVAAIGRFGDGQGGTIYQLDADTLAVQKTIALSLKPFALAIDNKAGILYAGHSLESSITAIDVATGQVRQTVQLDVKNAEGKTIHTRQLLVDEATGTLYVGGVDKTGIIWALDGQTLAIKKTLQSPDGKSIGLALEGGRLYATGAAAIEVIDAARLERVGYISVPKRQESDEKRRYFINAAVDGKTGRVFANESTFAGELFVFDAQTGQVLHTVETGKSPVGIRFNPVRGEVYVANREGGTVTVVDAASYAIKRQIALPLHPNSLALSPDGQVLFVTVKREFPKQGETDPIESVVRIDL